MKRTFVQAGFRTAGGKVVKRNRFIGPVMPGRIAVRRAAVRRRAVARRNLASMGFLGIERKFYDTALVSQAITAPADATGGELDPSATSMISTPTQGDGEQQRDGRQISCLYVSIEGVVKLGAQEDIVDPPPSMHVFIACVLDTQSNGAQMNSEDCFKNTAANAALAPSCQRNLLFGARFRILKQKMFVLTPNTLATRAQNLHAANGTCRPFNWFIPLRGLKINFNGGTTASIANVIDNSIHIIGYADHVTGTPNISYNARLRFMG